MRWALGLALIGLLCAAAPVVAKPKATKPAAAPMDYLPALKGDYFKLDSKEVGRPFHIFIAYPEGYDPKADARYATVYLLDGDSLFPMLAPHSLFLHYDDQLPKVITVGIAYGSFDPVVNKRAYDYSMPAPDAKADQGGGAKFHAFLKHELLPMVDAKYRTDPEKRILVGQSRGGHFVLYSAMADPDLFWGRIGSNAAFTPGEDYFLDGKPAPAKRNDLKLLMVSGTQDRPNLRKAAVNWDKAWAARNDAPWQRRLQDIDGGTHAANITDAYRAGLRWFFDYQPPKAEKANY
jgi:uncharacterized protein